MSASSPAGPLREGGSGRAAPLYALVVETADSGTAPAERVAPPARHEIVARETLIGRSPASTVRLDDLFVSGAHARLLLRDHDLHLDDLGSTNMTRLNGVVVRTRVRVRPGDVLEFARVRCRIERVEPQRAASAPPEAGPAAPASVEEVSEAGPAAPPAAGVRGPDEDGVAPPAESSVPVGSAPPRDGLESAPPRVFPAGPLPGEPRRSRLRAAGWLAVAAAVLLALLLR